MSDGSLVPDAIRISVAGEDLSCVMNPRQGDQLLPIRGLSGHAVRNTSIQGAAWAVASCFGNVSKGLPIAMVPASLDDHGDAVQLDWRML
ncbi:MAG: hypothetical protein AMXMBFR20_36680 [Planctomycetia bacterium]